jgi:hypothetical protein
MWRNWDEGAGGDPCVFGQDVSSADFFDLLYHVLCLPCMDWVSFGKEFRWGWESVGLIDGIVIGSLQ